MSRSRRLRKRMNSWWVALHAPPDHRAVEHVHGGEQRRRAVADVVVRHRAGPPLLHRQAGLRAVESLDLRLLVDREDDSMGRRVDVKADHIADLAGELRVIYRKSVIITALNSMSVGAPGRSGSSQDGLFSCFRSDGLMSKWQSAFERSA